MGLIKHVMDVFQTIYEEGEKEWLDESKYKEMLDDLYTKIENGEISEEEYEEAEQEILDQLRAIRNYKQEHGIE